MADFNFTSIYSLFEYNSARRIESKNVYVFDYSYIHKNIYEYSLFAKKYFYYLLKCNKVEKIDKSYLSQLAFGIKQNFTLYSIYPYGGEQNNGWFLNKITCQREKILQFEYGYIDVEERLNLIKTIDKSEEGNNIFEYFAIRHGSYYVMPIYMKILFERLPKTNIHLLPINNIIKNNL